ncbi:MAG: ATP12 family protein [Pseudomonadota bacterium]
MADVTITQSSYGYVLEKSGKPLRLSNNNPAVIADYYWAKQVADEWRSAKTNAALYVMPVSYFVLGSLSLTDDTIVKIRTQILDYADTDLLWYWAREETDLWSMQMREWAPWQRWAEQHFGVSLVTGDGFDITQPQAYHDALAIAVSTLDVLRLCAVQEVVSLTGSLVLGLAALQQACKAEELWDTAHLEARFQRLRWGEMDAHDDQQGDRIGREKIGRACDFLALCASRT